MPQKKKLNLFNKLSMRDGTKFEDALTIKGE